MPKSTFFSIFCPSVTEEPEEPEGTEEPEPTEEPDPEIIEPVIPVIP